MQFDNLQSFPAISRALALILFCLVAYQKLSVEAAGMKCVVVLDNAEKWVKANEECGKSNPVDQEKLKNADFNIKFEEFDFDDNCFIQCVYKTAGILTPEGGMDKKQTGEVFKGNMTTEMLETSIKVWDTCIDESDKIGKAKSLKPCAILALHDFCFNKMGAEKGITEMTC